MSGRDRRPARARSNVAHLLVLLAAAGCTRGAPPLVVYPSAPPAAVLIQDVTIFDGLSAASTPARDVLIEGGLIRRIATGGTLAAPGARVIDGAGTTLLPGLIDVHGHVGGSSAPAWMGALPDPARNLESYLYAGVTTVLDPCDLVNQAFDRRDAVAEDDLLGPRIFTAGPIFTAPGGHPVGVLRMLAPWWIRWYLTPRWTRQVASAEEARAAVDTLAALRPDVIKVAVDAVPLDAPILAPAVLRSIVDAARAHGIRTVAHIGTTADALAAADAGVAAWMHGVYKERIPDELVPRFVAAGIPYVATIVVFDSYADLFEGRREATALERETVSADVLKSFLPIPADYDLSTVLPLFRVMAEARAARRDNVRRLHAAGVTILAGADAQSGVFPGPGLHRELALLVASGLTPARALRAATGDAARFVTNSADPDFGILAEGKIADLMLVTGDPTRDIADVSRIREVLVAGVPLERHPIRPD